MRVDVRRNELNQTLKILPTVSFGNRLKNSSIIVFGCVICLSKIVRRHSSIPPLP